MRTNANARDVAADLIGGPVRKAPKNKARAKTKTKVKAKSKPASASDRQTYDDNAKIKLNGDWSPRKGARTEKIFNALRKSKTVGAFRSARERMGLTGVGKLFVQLIDKKILRLVH